MNAVRLCNNDHLTSCSCYFSGQAKVEDPDGITFAGSNHPNCPIGEGESINSSLFWAPDVQSPYRRLGIPIHNQCYGVLQRAFLWSGLRSIDMDILFSALTQRCHSSRRYLNLDYYELNGAANGHNFQVYVGSEVRESHPRVTSI